MDADNDIINGNIKTFNTLEEMLISMKTEPAYKKVNACRLKRTAEFMDKLDALCEEYNLMPVTRTKGKYDLTQDGGYEIVEYDNLSPLFYSVTEATESDRPEYGNYSCEIGTIGRVMAIEEFKTACINKSFIDYDGHGHPAKDGGMDPMIEVKPSLLFLIPKDATHIVWYNR
jgi:hypothetical protein